MDLINSWSLGHFLIWYALAKLTRIDWRWFLFLSIGWEVLEWVLPFEFAKELLHNKVSDVGVNILGFYLGKRSSGNTEASG